jgi:hypothetical protein
MNMRCCEIFEIGCFVAMKNWLNDKEVTVKTKWQIIDHTNVTRDSPS